MRTITELMVSTNVLLGSELTAVRAALISDITLLETYAGSSEPIGTNSLSGVTTSITSASMVTLCATAAVVVRI